MQYGLKVCDLAAALARLGGNYTLLREIAEFFRDDSPKLIERMKNALARSDGTDLHRAAHSLRGLVVNFYAEATDSAARDVEQIGQAGNFTQAGPAVERLEQEIGRLAKELNATLARPS